MMALPEQIHDTMIEGEGTLIADGQARVLPMDRHGQMAPVLVLHAISPAPGGRHVHLEYPFPAGQMAACEAAARQFAKGMRVQFGGPSAHAALVLRHVSHIHIVATDDDPSTTTTKNKEGKHAHHALHAGA